jgi:hypothetical protein
MVPALALASATAGIPGVLRRSTEKRTEIVERWRRLGADVWYDYQMEAERDGYRGDLNKLKPPGPQWLRDSLGTNCLANVEYFRFPGSDSDREPPEPLIVTGDLLKTLALFTGLKGISISDYKECWTLKDSDFEFIASLPRLQRLTVQGIQVTDGFLKYCKDQSELNFLWLVKTGVTGTGLADLNQSAPLTEVRLEGEAVNDKALELLSHYTGINRLQLASKKLTSAGLSHISKLKNVEFLDISEAKNITDDGLRSFEKLSNLRYLTIWGADGITGTGLASLKHLADLEDLRVSGKGLSTEGIQAIGELTQLQKLAITDSGVSEEWELILKRALPKTKLDLDRRRS